MRKRIDPPFPKTVPNDEPLGMARAQLGVQSQQSPQGGALVIPALQARQIAIQVGHQDLRISLTTEPGKRKAVTLTCIRQLAGQQQFSNTLPPLNSTSHPNEPCSRKPGTPFVSEQSTDLIWTHVKSIRSQGGNERSLLRITKAEKTTAQKFQISTILGDIAGHNMSLANVLRMLHAHRRIMAHPSEGRLRLSSENPKTSSPGPQSRL